MKYIYRFHHKIRVVEFGPYEDEWEALNAFQWAYGYYAEPFDFYPYEYRPEPFSHYPYEDES